MRPLVDCAEHGAVVRLLADRHGDMKRSGAGASASRSIFIASSTTIGSPSRTGAPSSASQRTTVPPSSAVTGVPSAAVLAFDVGAGRERPPSSAASRPESTPRITRPAGVRPSPARRRDASPQAFPRADSAAVPPRSSACTRGNSHWTHRRRPLQSAPAPKSADSSTALSKGTTVGTP